MRHVPFAVFSTRSGAPAAERAGRLQWFKSDVVRIGSGCTLGTNAFAHYGITMGEHSVLEADAFLMKGETVDAYTVWRGNPAKLHRRFRTAETEVASAETCAPVAELQDLMIQKEAAE
mgnify:CR=1 FL=1